MVAKDFPFLAELNRSIEAHQPHIQRLRRLYKFFYHSHVCPPPKKGPRPLSKRAVSCTKTLEIRVFLALTVFVGPLGLYALGILAACICFCYELALSSTGENKHSCY